MVGKIPPEALPRQLNIITQSITGPEAIQEFFDEVTPIIREHIGQSLLAGKGADDNALLPLAHPRLSGAGQQPLLASMDLYKSLTRQGAKGSYEYRSATTLRIGSQLPYAAKQHEGGTTTPVNAKNLTLPLTGEAEGHRPRDFPGPLVCRVRDDKAIGLEDESTGILHYLFSKKTKNPARRFLGWGPTLIKKVSDAFIKVAERRVAKA